MSEDLWDRVLGALRDWGFKKVWTLDTEFESRPGARPIPICLVAHDLLSREVLRLWLWGVPTPPCPFSCDHDELLVCHAGDAEAGTFLALGWPRPISILDTHAEFRNLANSTRKPLLGYGLLGALKFFGMPARDKEEKAVFYALAERGGPYTEQEQSDWLDYCDDDVQDLDRLLPPLFEAAELFQFSRMCQALRNGGVASGNAEVYSNGIPIDVALRIRWDRHLETIKRKIVGRLQTTHDVFANGDVSPTKFGKWLLANNIRNWPRTRTGRPSLDREVFSDFAKIYPQAQPIKHARHLLAQLRLDAIPIGPDGRNRTSPLPFTSLTGRYQPAAKEAIFSHPAYTRSLIKPTEGMAVAYIDLSSEEPGIVAALSGDEVFWNDCASGDLYLTFAIHAGKAPRGATKSTHRELREIFKVLQLASTYGQGASGFAHRARISITEAASIMRAHRRRYWKSYTWSDRLVERALMGFPAHHGVRLAGALGRPAQAGGEGTSREVGTIGEKLHGAGARRRDPARGGLSPQPGRRPRGCPGARRGADRGAA